MSLYTHLTIEEREMLLVLHAQKESKRSIARKLGRSPSTISRELKRNKDEKKKYSPSAAQRKYIKRRKKCKPHRLLENESLKNKVQQLLFQQQWSPEQISARLRYEKGIDIISHNTIYRGIYAKIFDTELQRRTSGHRGAIRKLRRKGKRRHKRGETETRGKIVISNELDARPEEANKRVEIGHWEADTVAGKRNKACLVTITDRKSRYLLAEKISRKQADYVSEKMISIFSKIPSKFLKTVTPDRGKEFAKHTQVTKAFKGLDFYFPNPGAPWERGTNENTNGLIREYLPKSIEMDLYSDEEIAVFIEKINKRPRKCLGWKSPYEVFYDRVLHLT